MDSATQRAGMLTLDELCKEADLTVPGFAAPEFRQASLVELVRRAKEMEARLSPKPEDEPQSEPMPEPVEVWLYQNTLAGYWSAKVTDKDHRPEPLWREWSGPHKIIPGTMSLDELASYGIFLSHSDGTFMWCVKRRGEIVWSDNTNTTALEAQWAATQLAKGAGHAD